MTKPKHPHHLVSEPWRPTGPQTGMVPSVELQQATADWGKPNRPPRERDRLLRPQAPAPRVLPQPTPGLVAHAVLGHRVIK